MSHSELTMTVKSSGFSVLHLMQMFSVLVSTFYGLHTIKGLQ